MRHLVCLFVVCSLAACSATARMYAGEPRPAAEIAIIVAGYNYDVTINRVDGRHNGWQRVEVEPGYHVIEGSCMPDPGDDYCPVGEVTAFLEAGQIYVLEASTWGMSGECEFHVLELDPLNPYRGGRIAGLSSGS